MKPILFILILVNLLNAKMYIYSFETKSLFSVELPSKVEKKLKLNARYSMGVRNAAHDFDLQGQVFKNRIVKVNMSNLKVYSVKNNKQYNIKVKSFKAITKVSLNNKYIGKVKWNSVSQLNSALTQLAKNHLITGALKK